MTVINGRQSAALVPAFHFESRHLPNHLPAPPHPPLYDRSEAFPQLYLAVEQRSNDSYGDVLYNAKKLWVWVTLKPLQISLYFIVFFVSECFKVK